MIIVTDGSMVCSTDSLKALERSIIKYSPNAVILREKQLTDLEYQSLAEAAMRLADRYKVKLFVNRRDIAERLGIRHFHTGYADFIANGRGSFAEVSVSVHSSKEVSEAARLGADAVILGHVFDTECKRGKQSLGIDKFAEIVAGADVPVIAIGGINRDNYERVLSCGAADYCSMSGAMNLTF